MANEKIQAPHKSNVEPLDYSRVENWIINTNHDLNTDFDLIFFCGTTVFDSSEEDGTALMTGKSRSMGYGTYVIAGSQLSENARVFCPLQRQMSVKYSISATSHDEMLRNIGTKEPYIDLEAALDYYFDNYNKDAKRPFVLAGHSQGAAALQVCLRRYFLDTDKRCYLENMIAAYVLGYGISKNYYDTFFDKKSVLHFAEGAGDYNCIISWNTEGPGKKGPSYFLADEGDQTLVINPLNWKRDETYAGIQENHGILHAEPQEDGSIRCNISQLKEDLCDAQIDLKRGSVICTTLTDYVGKSSGKDDVWGGKSLHFYDGKAYYNNIKQNLKLRVSNFLRDKADKKK